MFITLLFHVQCVVTLHSSCCSTTWRSSLFLLVFGPQCVVVTMRHSSCCCYLMFIMLFSLLWFGTTIAPTLFCWLEFHWRQKTLLSVCNFNKLLHIRYIYIFPKIVWFLFSVNCFSNIEYDILIIWLDLIMHE
jgi:hypothetical protein